MPFKSCYTCDEQFFYDYGEDWKTYCRRCYAIMMGRKERENNYQHWKASKKETKDDINITDKTMLKKLIYLCHPDKHNNSEIANEVTKYLMSMRNDQ